MKGHKDKMKTDSEETLAPTTKKLRGFARLDPEKRRAISSMGGKAAHEMGVAHQFTAESGKIAGRLGGVAPHRVRGRGSRFLPQDTTPEANNPPAPDAE